MTVRIYPAPQDQANIIYWSGEHPADCPVCGGVGQVKPGRLWTLDRRIVASWFDAVPCPWPFGLEALVAGVTPDGGPRATA